MFATQETHAKDADNTVSLEGELNQAVTKTQQMEQTRPPLFGADSCTRGEFVKKSRVVIAGPRGKTTTKTFSDWGSIFSEVVLLIKLHPVTKNNVTNIIDMFFCI